MCDKRLTGQIKFREQARLLRPAYIVLQVEELIRLEIQCPVLNYEAVRYVWRDATPSDSAEIIVRNPALRGLLVAAGLQNG